MIFVSCIAFVFGVAIRHFTILAEENAKKPTELITKTMMEEMPEDTVEKNEVEPITDNVGQGNEGSGTSLINERTFENCYKVTENSWGEKVPYKIKISKTSAHRLTVTVSFVGNNANSSTKEEVRKRTVYDLKFDRVTNGAYFYDGNNNRIKTYRPLDDFISDGISSDKKLNKILYINTETVINGPDGFGIE